MLKAKEAMQASFLETGTLWLLTERRKQFV